MTAAAAVLFAEDVKPVGLKPEHVVTALGFEPISVTDGAEALLVCSKTRRSVVIIGTAMPVIDGTEVCRRIRQRSSEAFVNRQQAARRTQHPTPDATDDQANPLPVGLSDGG